MAIEERNGVRVGIRVRNLDGKDLGRVTRLHEWGFEVEKGFPILFRRELVATYDEVRGIRDGALVLARSDHALFDLAQGEIPESWRIAAPPGFPQAATPAEARGVVDDLAARSPVAPPRAMEPVTEPAKRSSEPDSHDAEIHAETGEAEARDDEREYERSGAQPAGHPAARA
jgi:hypothetical protein